MRIQEQIRIPIFYHSGQEQILFKSKAKKKVVVKGRRWGLTKGVANYLIELMLDGISPLLWVDTINSNIDRYIERYFFPVLKYLPQNFWKWRQQKKELTIDLSKLDMRSADKPENIEGFAYKVIFLNEAGIILRNEYLWHNTIQPMMLDYNPEVIIGGTPKGKGLFHRLAIKAQDPEEKNWEYFHFTSFDNPYLSQEEINELINEIPKLIQRQEIYAEFLEDSSIVFRNIEKCKEAIPEKPKRNKSYYAGVDLARTQDFTVLIILDEKGRQVYMDRFNIIDWKFQISRIADAIKKYNAQLALDSTGVGDPIFEALRDEGLQIEGYRFTNEFKKQLIQSLMMSFDLEEIKIFDDPILINELKIFEYEITSSGTIKYSAPEGYHDDCVIALALANWCLKTQNFQPMIWRP
jgi:hypothetical protein